MFGQKFVYGGKTATGAVNDLWSFDLRSKTWMQRANGPNPVYGHKAIAAFTDTGAKMYVHGGRNTDGSYRNDLLSYDLNTQRWENIAVQGDLPSPRAFHVAWFEAPNKIIFSGGRGYNSSGVLTDLDDVWFFDSWYGIWRKKPRLYTPRSSSAAVVVPKSSSKPSSSSMRSQNQALASVSTSTVVLFFGGLRDGQPIAETFEYTGQDLSAAGVSAIPARSEWTMILMALLLASLGAFALRRR